jgi:subtilisin family serine protease
VDDLVGWDFVDDDGEVKGSDHGSHTGGEASRGSDSIKVMPFRVLDDGRTIGGQLTVEAIEYAAAHGARLVNLSYQVFRPKDVAMVKAAIEQHPEILFLKSAGNDGEKLDGGEFEPETDLAFNLIPNMMVVAASEDQTGARYPWSNYGSPYATHAVQGTNVYSAVNDRSYGALDGTSMATPKLANIAAKCLLLDPQLSPLELRFILKETSVALPEWATLVESGGLANQAEAIRVAALTGLLHQGKTAEQALEQMSLPAEQRGRLLRIALSTSKGLVSGPPDPAAPTVHPLPSDRSRQEE